MINRAKQNAINLQGQHNMLHHQVKTALTQSGSPFASNHTNSPELRTVLTLNGATVVVHPTAPQPELNASLNGAIVSTQYSGKSTSTGGTVTRRLNEDDRKGSEDDDSEGGFSGFSDNVEVLPGGIFGSWSTWG